MLATDESVERLLELETPIGRALALTNRAQVAAYAGRAEEARRDAEDALALFDGASWTHAVVWPLATLGFLFSFLLWREERGPEAHGLERAPGRAA